MGTLLSDGPVLEYLGVLGIEDESERVIRL